MGSKDEPGMLVVLLGLAAALYAVTWLIAGPPGSWNAFASTPTALVSPMVPTPPLTGSAPSCSPDLYGAVHPLPRETSCD